MLIFPIINDKINLNYGSLCYLFFCMVLAVHSLILEEDRMKKLFMVIIILILIFGIKLIMMKK